MNRLTDDAKDEILQELEKQVKWKNRKLWKLVDFLCQKKVDSLQGNYPVYMICQSEKRKKRKKENN